MILYFILLPAVIFDICTFRIPNKLAIIGWISGFIYQLLRLGEYPAFYYLFSAVAIFFILIPFFKIRAIGGGDVKLLSVCAMFTGVESCLYISIYALFFAGIYSLFYLVYHRIFSLNKKKTNIIHFSIPVFFGVIANQLWGGFLWQIF